MGIEESQQDYPALKCETANRPYMAALRTDARIAVLYRPRCKKWSCPACAEFNKWRWGKRATYGALELLEADTPLSFLTLTSNGAVWSVERTILVFSRAWPALRKRATVAGGKFDYFIVPEKHKDGRLHLHGMVSLALSTRWWKDKAAGVGLGYHADEKPVRDALDVSRYVIKHLDKQMQTEGWPKGFRRIRTSRSWPKEPEAATPAGWEFKTSCGDKAAERTYRQLKREEYTIVQAGQDGPWPLIDRIDAAYERA